MFEEIEIINEEIIKRSHTELLKLQSITTELKNLVWGFNSTFR